MTKEIYHQGWLIKSPPTKRIWRARWRRRFFTLKQGEIPEQFCLEYYKSEDTVGRKPKGSIDLDQCEQVDSGLKLEHRNQKFQYMFDVKTPLRTYYLAASSEEDMNAWVNCICEVCNLQDLSKPQQSNAGDVRQYYNITTETNDHQSAAASVAAGGAATSTTANPSSMVTLKSTTLSPVKSSSASSDQVALLPTAEPIDNNNSVYQNYDAMCRNSNYNNRETLICDVPLSKNAIGADGKTDAKESYYNFMAIANTTANRGGQIQLPNEPIALQNNRNSGAHRKIPENLKLTGVLSSASQQAAATSSSTGPYIAISDCISGNPLIDKDNPATPLNSLDPKFYDTPRSHFNIGLNLTNEQPYSPKRNNIQTLPSSQMTTQSGKSSPTDSESVFTDDEDWLPMPDDSVNGERRMRPSESSVENDPIVFRYTQRFSKMPDNDESVTIKRTHVKKPHSVAGLSLEKNDSEEHNKDVNSSDTENASPAIAYGPKDINSYVDESYDIPRSHQLPYTRIHDGNSNSTGSYANNNSNMDSVASTSASMLELSEDRSSIKMASDSGESEFSSSTMPKRRHFYTNAAPAKFEGTFFRYDFEDKQSAPIVHRNLKPKLSADDNDTKLMTPNKLKTGPTTKSALNQPVAELKPPCIDDIRKLKPTTPIKLETSTLRRGMFTTISDAEFRGGDSSKDQISKTLPRNYNNSATHMTTMMAPLSAAAIVASTPMPMPLATTPAAVTSSTTTATTTTTPATPAATAAPLSSQAPAAGRQAGVLEYFDLDHSNPPPICNNNWTISASTSNLNSQSVGASPWQTNLSHRLSSVSISSSSVSGNANASNDAIIGTTNPLGASLATSANVNPSTSSGIVYKSVDFIKTEAFMRTRQDAELTRAKNRSKE